MFKESQHLNYQAVEIATHEGRLSTSRLHYNSQVSSRRTFNHAGHAGTSPSQKGKGPYGGHPAGPQGANILGFENTK